MAESLADRDTVNIEPFQEKRIVEQINQSFINDDSTQVTSLVKNLISNSGKYQRSEILDLIYKFIDADTIQYLKNAYRLHKNFIGLGLVADQILFIKILLFLTLKSKERSYLDQVELLVNRISEQNLPDDCAILLLWARAKIYAKEKLYLSLLSKLSTHSIRYLQLERYQTIFISIHIELYRLCGSFKYLEQLYDYLITNSITYTDNEDLLRDYIFLLIQIWRKKPCRNIAFQIDDLFKKLQIMTNDPMNAYSWARFLYEASLMYSSLNLAARSIEILEKQHSFFKGLGAFSDLLIKCEIQYALLDEDEITLDKIITNLSESKESSLDLSIAIANAYLEKGNLSFDEIDYRNALKILNDLESDAEDVVFYKALAYQKLAEVKQNAFYLTIALSMAKDGLKKHKYSDRLFLLFGDIFYLLYESSEEASNKKLKQYLKNSILSYQNAVRILRSKNRIPSKELVIRFANAMKEYGDLTAKIVWVDRAISVLLKEEYKYFFDFSFLNLLADSYLVKGLYEKNLLYFRLALFYFEDVLDESIYEDSILSKMGFICLNIAFLEVDTDEKSRYYRQAEEYLVKAIHMNSITAVYHLSCLYSILGYIDQSIKCLSKLVSSEVMSERDYEEDPWLIRTIQSEQYDEFLKENSHIFDMQSED